MVETTADHTELMKQIVRKRMNNGMGHDTLPDPRTGDDDDGKGYLEALAEIRRRKRLHNMIKAQERKDGEAVREEGKSESSEESGDSLSSNESNRPTTLCPSKRAQPPPSDSDDDFQSPPPKAAGMQSLKRM